MKWPERFVHDELWLRTRRLLLTGLDSVGLSIGADDYRDYMGGQVALGRDLLTALAERLHESQFAHMASERFLGAHNRRFSRRLPIILAFGAEYADCVGAVNGGRVRDGRAVRECAGLFNLGISIFDHLTDRRELLPAVAEIVDGGRLEDLIGSGASADVFLSETRERSANDLSVLRGIIGAFFSDVHRLRESGTNAEAWERLGASMGEAYRAQWMTASGRGPSTNGDTAPGAKSIEPFVIMALIVLLAAAGPRNEAMIDLACAVGRVFWRVDDLVDLSADWHSRQASGLVSADEPAGRSGEDDSLRRFLEDGSLEVAAGHVFDDVKTIIASLEQCDEEARARFLRWMGMYIVDWTH